MKYKIGLICGFIFTLFLSNCKKSCSETWKIGGKLVNATTQKPVANIGVNIAIDNGSLDTRKTFNMLYTNDSGEFSLEYSCDDKTYSRIFLSTNTGGYILQKDQIQSFTKDFYKVFYHADSGRVQIKLNPKAPIGSDTLYIGVKDFSSTPGWIAYDSFVGNVPNDWKSLRLNVRVKIFVFAARGKSQFNKALSNQTAYYYKNVWPFNLTGDPIVDPLNIDY